LLNTRPREPALPRFYATTTTPEPDPLAPYLQFTQEGQWYVGALYEGGRTVSLYAKTRDEIEQRAREILASRGIEV
jgi:hypothetical protein